MTLLLHAIDSGPTEPASTGGSRWTQRAQRYSWLTAPTPNAPAQNGRSRLVAFHAGHGLAVRLLETHIAKNREALCQIPAPDCRQHGHA